MDRGKSSVLGRADRRSCRRWVGDAVVIGQKIPRIEGSRRSREFRQHGAVPGLAVALQPIEDSFLPNLEIGPLARVLNQVEQKFIALDPQVLPVAVADSAL